MPRSTGQTLKIITLEKIFNEQTDENHTLSVKELIELLDSYGIKSERKSIYTDIETLQDFGMDIICINGSCNRYYLGTRLFETAELKLLADAVSSSKFITEKKSQQLINKISKLTNNINAQAIKRQVYVRGRAKSENEKIYYNTDTIHQAILEHKKISFQYFDLIPKKDIKGFPLHKYRDNGNPRIVYPLALLWDNENYYLNSYYEAKKRISNFRVDKMDNVIKLDSKFDNEQYTFDISEYSKKVFGMFTGKIIHVRLVVHNSIIGAFYDKFGYELHIECNYDNNTSLISFDVQISPPFIGWIFQFYDMIKILYPTELKTEIKNYANTILNNL